MIQIDDTLVSLDLIERSFLCDLSHCKGQCCVEGDSGAPLEPGEEEELKRVLPEARTVIQSQGVAYTDSDGDRVTSIVGDKNCVFTCYDTDGVCKCAIEKAYREGRVSFYKPISCHLYPVRITQYKTFQAVNYHRWDVCKAAELLGKKEQVPVYQFLKEPLIRKFGQAWYDALDECAQEWKKQS